MNDADLGTFQIMRETFWHFSDPSLSVTYHLNDVLNIF